MVVEIYKYTITAEYGDDFPADITLESLRQDIIGELYETLSDTARTEQVALAAAESSVVGKQIIVKVYTAEHRNTDDDYVDKIKDTYVKLLEAEHTVASKRVPGAASVSVENHNDDGGSGSLLLIIIIIIVLLLIVALVGGAAYYFLVLSKKRDSPTIGKSQYDGAEHAA